MTKEELRELDAWIAERVMGFCWVDVPPDYDGKNAGHALVPAAYREGYQWPPKGKIDEYALVPNYSTDSALAMWLLKRVHEKLDCEDVCVGRCDGMDWCGGDWYLYSIFRENRSEIGQWRVNGQTLEEAICLFVKQVFSGEKHSVKVAREHHPRHRPR